MSSKKYYIAYGSNLNLEQMKRRCPTAQVVGVSELVGYKLTFKGALTNAYATIEESTDCTVPVLIWELQPQDEKALDRYEGYPSFYFKEMHTVVVNKESIEAMVYIMNKKYKVGFPSADYFDVIRKGYNDNGLRIEYLEKSLIESSELVNTQGE